MAEIRPTLGIKDLERELKFFGALGFEIAERWDAGAVVQLEGAQITLELYEPLRVGDAPLLDWDRSPGSVGTGVQIYVMVPDVRAVAERIPVGVPRPWPVQDKSWGMRELTVKSPSGYLLTFAQPLRG
jgi:catechol 2,3-dioxygenase-like lactoylglutathione lyase family enzyme